MVYGKVKELIEEIIRDYREEYAESVEAGDYDKGDAINECIDNAMPIYYSDMIDIIRDGNWWIFSDIAEPCGEDFSPYDLCCDALRQRLVDEVYSTYYDELDEKGEDDEEDEEDNDEEAEE